MRSSRDGRVELTAQEFEIHPGPASGHNIEHDNPQLVAEVIQQMVTEISGRGKLAR